MIETLHVNKRARQRGITKEMIDLTLEFGKREGDKIKLGTRHIKKLLNKHRDIKPLLLKILDKGGLIVVFSGAVLITAYGWR